MIPAYLLLLLPLLGILYFGLLGHKEDVGKQNIRFNGVTLLLSLWLAVNVFLSGTILSTDQYFIVDSFNVYLIVLTAFVGFTTSIFSAPYMAHEQEIGKLTANRLRLYYSMYQGFMFAMYLVLTTNNMGIMWVAMEAATLATVLLVSLYRTPESIEAAWKYFILCGVGIAQALFGTILLYYAAIQISDVDNALTWSVLYENAKLLDPEILEIAFVFMLIGYGTKIGLVPLHNWLPDAHSEGPTPMSAVLSGLLLNDALYAVVRNKMLVDGATDSHIAGYLMMGFGMLSFLVAAFFLHRQKDIKRLFSYSSIEHMGLMTFAFGIGTPFATFAALLHMTVHSLTKSAIFVTVGHAAQISGTQSIEKIRGLIKTQPQVGWGLLIGTLAIAGFPPFGVFASEFLVLLATMQSYPWLAPFLLLGIGIACAGLFRNIQPMVYGEKPEGQQAVQANLWPVMIHLAIVLWLGLAMPDFLADWFTQATILISGSAPL
ncbi:hydrogenase 4 subunit F [methanotrophic endosymbiont of Bathymodiolus puteoserpentis (Logatchev)]|jgi:hydrogenase-4 component F|uniref:hydrogenase 4 subunit F n=1 Tax=methanotrophic endosymbiont of Bathymodiolus puteoserpentis (Logatchev) TaxID=343235 RepID=UPI0013C788B1|nr:hydrogenase 4 subunit F [methanotrophic endosymbiont of Bathymodiolus puteoserpentis (Logatchev)]SHE21988.1 Formate hydrogenlyase subunit 3/Multisubunit Na+/H+ antiporter, MnhD subunit [methanotrophic endosymbiont of Bathymodiolus puteoserpentis (Logatchev)]